MSTRGSLTERKGVSRCVNVWDLWSRVQGLNSALQAAKKNVYIYAIREQRRLTLPRASEHSQPSLPGLVSLWQPYLANEGPLAAAILVGRHAKCTCCQTYLRWDKVNYAVVRALSSLSDMPGVCTGAALPGLQECHSVDSALWEITELS